MHELCQLSKHFINILIYMTLTARTVELPLFIFHPHCRYLATPNRLPITHHLNQQLKCRLLTTLQYRSCRQFPTPWRADHHR
ncbi:TPA: hypothetical protein MIU27_14640 [Klebsiella pneumoniae]|nr:hypothetical protein [Klebsiella pneumoniae]